MENTHFLSSLLGLTFMGFYCGFGLIWIVMYLLIFVVIIAGLVGWVLMLVDVVQRGEDEFPNKTKDQKLMWLLIVILAGYIGAFIYYLMVYKKFGKAKRN